MKKMLDPVKAGVLTKQKKLFLGIIKESSFIFITLFSIASFGFSPNRELKLVEKSVNVIAPVSKETVKANEKLAATVVTGKVTGELGESLPGAYVKVKGTNKVVSTDVDGSYSIDASETDVLIVSYIGYTTKEVKVGNQKQLNIKLKLAQNELNEIVIIGYQKAHRTISLIALKKNDPNIGLTCKSPMYQWISGNTDTEDLFLIDPNRFPPFRICALRAVVYHYRDVTPIINSKEKLVEWHKRKQIIEEAYGTRDGKAIVDVANRFGVKYVVSEGCIPIPGHEPVYRDGKFDCVYKVLTDYK